MGTHFLIKPVYLTSLREIARLLPPAHHSPAFAATIPQSPDNPTKLTTSTMSADTVTHPLTKIDSATATKDSAIDDAPASPTESKIKHRRTSSTVSGVFNINDLEKQNVDL